MRRANALMELWPWAGLIGAGLAWALDHQIGSDGTFYDCSVGSPLAIIVGLVALLVTAASGVGSFRLWRSDRETSGRRFVALIGVLFALLLAVAIILPTVAGFIMPECLA